LNDSNGFVTIFKYLLPNCDYVLVISHEEETLKVSEFNSKEFDENFFESEIIEFVYASALSDEEITPSPLLTITIYKKIDIITYTESVINKNKLLVEENLEQDKSKLENSVFLAPIPSEFIFSKEKPLLLHFDLKQLEDITYFSRIISTRLVKGCVYTVFIKVRYDIDSFTMCGSQFGFPYNSMDNISVLLDTIITRLDESLSHYQVGNESIVYVQVSFRKLSSKLLSEFTLEKPSYISEGETKLVRKDLTIPMSINENSLGLPLRFTTDKDNNIAGIYLPDNGVNFLDVINENSRFLSRGSKSTTFDSAYKFYLINQARKHVLGVKDTGRGDIIKVSYSLDGILISKVIDTMVGDHVIRKSGNNELILKDNIVKEYKQKINLKPVEKVYIKPLMTENPNIGVIDCETYTGNGGINKIYALGFLTNLSDKSQIYYIDKETLDSDKIVLDLVNELLRPKYNDITFYCHNMGGYDIVFILNVLFKYNSKNPDKYTLNCVLKDDKIIKVKISKKLGEITHSFTIQDSYCMLSKSLKALGNSFKVDTLKSYFPYKFSVSDNLFYVGDTPDIIYYQDISEEVYKSLCKTG